MQLQHPIDGHCDERFAAVRRAFERNFCERGEVGAAVTIYIDAEPVVDLWGGFADAGRERPWLHDTIAHVASTTKGMTSICMHRLVEEGRLDLDASVARYWPEFAQAGKGDLPVHLLLSHRPGLQMRYGLGFLLGQRAVPFGPSPRAFGHPGMGGSIAFADPDARIGFGYVVNQLQSGLAGDARGYPLIRALYDSL